MTGGTWASDRKAALTMLGPGPCFPVTDNDLWGLQNAIQHCIDNGYFKENEEWAEAMLDHIRVLRFGQDYDKDNQ